MIFPQICNKSLHYFNSSLRLFDGLLNIGARINLSLLILDWHFPQIYNNISNHVKLEIINSCDFCTNMQQAFK